MIISDSRSHAGLHALSLSLLRLTKPNKSQDETATMAHFQERPPSHWCCPLLCNAMQGRHARDITSRPSTIYTEDTTNCDTSTTPFYCHLLNYSTSSPFPL